MNKLTKEEVIKFLKHIRVTFPGSPDLMGLRLGEAYLALLEEVKKSEREWVEQNALYILACKDRDELKADNQLLKEAMNQERNNHAKEV